MTKKKTYRQHSNSRISAFTQCPHKYELLYIHKVKTEVPEVMAIGRAVHDAVDMVIKECIKDGVPRKPEIWEKCASKAIMKNHITIMKSITDIRRMVKVFAMERELDIKTVVGSEQQFALDRKNKSCDWRAKETYFRAKVDLLQVQDNIGKITDFKTGRTVRKDEFQLKAYAWVTMCIYPQLEGIEVCYDYLSKDLITHPKVILRKDLDKIQEEILTKCRIIDEATEFEAVRSRLCDYCQVKSVCKLMKKGGKVYKDMITKQIEESVKPPKTKNEALKLAGEYLVIRDRMKEIKEKLQGYIENKGELNHEGHKFYITEGSVSYSIRDLEEFLKDAKNMNYYSIAFGCLAFNKTKAKVHLEDPQFEKLVKLHSEQSFTNGRFSVKKAD